MIVKSSRTFVWSSTGHARSPGELHRDLLVLDTRGPQQQDAGAGGVGDSVTEQFYRHYLVTETIMTKL